MRIAIIGRTEILYNVALQLYEDGHQIVCIITSQEAPEYTRKSSDFRELADSWQIPFAQGGPIAKYAELLGAAQADIAVSINYTGVVPQSVIDLFPLGVLNAHGGDLPRYRGNACQAWAIINGEERIGLCIHKMIGGELDSGDIIAREYFAINHNTKVTRVWEWMLSRTPALILQAIQKLEANPSFVLEQQSKDSSVALRCYPRMPEDARIDWRRAAIDVLRLINASNKPYVGAFCFLDHQTVIIWDAQLADDAEIFCAVPGQITKLGNGFVDVACGSGKLRIFGVEIHGRSDSPRFWIKSIRQRLT